MIEFLSNNITDFFYSNNIIEENEKEIIMYGLQLIISSIISISIILFLGTFFNRIIETLIFLIVFIVIRMYSGGYHANSYLKCNMTLIIVYLSVITVDLYTPQDFIFSVSIVLTAIALYVFLRHAPVDNENKRLSKQKMKTNRIITLLLVSAFYSISIVVYKTDLYMFYTIIITIFSISTLIILRGRYK